MLHVIKQELTALVDAMQKTCSKWTLVVQSDSTKANDKLYRLIVPLFSAKFPIQCKCLMHITALAIAGACAPLRVVGPVFCGCMLMAHGHTQGNLTTSVDHLFGNSNSLEIVVEGDNIPGEQVLVHWIFCIGMNTSSEGELARSGKADKERNYAIAELKLFLTCPLNNNGFAHACRFGCCSSAAQPKQRLVPVLLTLFVFRKPAVPALNKWTNMLPSLSFWCVATIIFNSIGRLWEIVFTEARLKQGGADSGAGQIDLTTPISSDTLSTIGVVRAREVLRWLRHPKTPVELLVVCIAMRHVLSLMGFLFQEESTAKSHSVTILLK